MSGIFGQYFNPGKMCRFHHSKKTGLIGKDKNKKTVVWNLVQHTCFQIAILEAHPKFTTGRSYANMAFHSITGQSTPCFCGSQAGVAKQSLILILRHLYVMSCSNHGDTDTLWYIYVQFHQPGRIAFQKEHAFPCSEWPVTNWVIPIYKHTN